MTKTTSLPRGIRAGATTLLIAGFGLGSVGTSFAADVIRVKGSDTMVQLASGWAEAYHKVKPGVRRYPIWRGVRGMANHDIDRPGLDIPGYFVSADRDMPVVAPPFSMSASV